MSSAWPIVLGCALLTAGAPGIVAAAPPKPRAAPAPAPAPAPKDVVEAPRRVALVPLRSTGLNELDHRELERRLQQALAHPALEIVQAPAPSCDEPGCIRELGGELGVTQLVRAEIEGSGRDFSITIEIVDRSLAATDAPARIARDCSICGVTELGDQLAAQAAIARQRILDTPEYALLEIHGQPEGARLTLDDARIGRLPFRGQVRPGPHELQIDARGYERRVIPLDASAGVEQSVHVELAPELRSQRWQRPVGWSALGLGLGSLGAGLSLIALHGQNVRRLCSTGEPFVIDADGDCRWVHETLGPGIGVAAAGVGLLAIGTGLLAIDARRQHARERDDLAISLHLGLDHANLQLQF